MTTEQVLTQVLLLSLVAALFCYAFESSFGTVAG
jgi:hypothetical protein